MEKILSAIAIIIGLWVVILYGLLFFHKEGSLTGKRDGYKKRDKNGKGI